MQTFPLSVVIMSYNEEKNIGRCIDSVRWIADEIIVLDAYSTDNTVALAQQKGAIVKQQAFASNIQQKNKAMLLTKFNYVLSLHADEALSIDLANAILEAKRHSNFKAFTMNHCTCFRGQFIRHGIWYPDKKLRLFDKRFARYSGRYPHDKIELVISMPVAYLEGEILQYSFNSFTDFLEHNEIIASSAAQSLFETNRKFGIAKMIFSPVWSFVNGYFFRLGFLDGYNGLLIAIYTANQSFKQYQKLQQLQKRSPTISSTLSLTQPIKAAV
ncbi:MAG: glycosyltransferase family 2 protein [Ferruginibacter sp.]|nr:glycosyltransferase family 2 protein [Ferruginibacter sp.]